MKKLFILLLIHFFLNNASYAKGLSLMNNPDTITILLKVKDTSFYQYANISGQVYHFINKKDTLYIRLGYTVGGYDMGVAGLEPNYKFRPSSPEAVYRIISNYSGTIWNLNKGTDTTLIRICNCESIRQKYFIDENLLRYQYLNEKTMFTGKCLSFYQSGILKEEKTYSNGLVTNEESWYENTEWRSQVLYKPNSKEIHAGSWYFEDGSFRWNIYDTLIQETYPDGQPKSLQRYSLLAPNAMIEYKSWSSDNHLVYHWKIIDGKRSILMDYNDSLEKIFPKLIYSTISECDSIFRIDSLVQINGFSIPKQLSGGTDYYYKKYLKARGEFKNNKLMNGQYFTYNCEGVLKRIMIFKEGKYYGDATID